MTLPMRSFEPRQHCSTRSSGGWTSDCGRDAVVGRRSGSGRRCFTPPGKSTTFRCRCTRPLTVRATSGRCMPTPAYYGEITHPSPQFIDLMAKVAVRLGGGEKYTAAPALSRLDQAMGGGKSHGLIGLYHLAEHPEELAGPTLAPSALAEASEDHRTRASRGHGQPESCHPRVRQHDGRTERVRPRRPGREPLRAVPVATVRRVTGRCTTATSRTTPTRARLSTR